MRSDTRPSRRSFLAASALGAASLSLGATPARGQEPAAAGSPLQPATRAPVRLAVVGVRSRGFEHVNAFARVPGCRIVALCDVDDDILQQRAAECRKGGGSRAPFEVATYRDPRALFASADVDAVAIATPNHTHAMLAAWALTAGKHVYVEKPVSHVVDEGQRLVELAARSGKVCATGTQARSSRAVQAAMQFVHGGGLGKVTCSRGLCYKPRRPIGRVAGPQFAPASVDYDRWLGPVAYRPLRRANLHYDWHWDLHTGNGDLGNQGIHQMDLARWALGWNALPDRVLSIGGRLGYADDGDSPNTQVVWFDCGGIPLLFEVRGLPKGKAEQAGKWQMDRYDGIDIGNVIHGERGTVRIGANYDRAAFFDVDGKQQQEWKGGGDHFANFIEAVAANDPQRLAAPIVDGHRSSAFCHYGIVSHRLGAMQSPDGVAVATKDLPPLAEAWQRMRDHLLANGVDLSATPVTVGRALAIDKASGDFGGDAEASALCHRVCREPYTF